VKNDYQIEVCSIEEAHEIIAKLEGRKVGVKGGFPLPHLLGHVDIVCREEDGSVAWENHKSNLVTDYARRRMAQIFEGNFSGGSGQCKIVTAPSTEPPSMLRAALLEAGIAPNVSRASSSVGSAYSSATHTRTWSVTLGVPAANTNIGTIGLIDTSTSYGDANVAMGVTGLLAYTKLPQVKVETTTQTLEIQYKVTCIVQL